MKGRTLQTVRALYYPTAQVAQLYGVHPNTIYAMAQRGEIPAKKVGGRYKFLQVEIDEHLARRGAERPEKPALAEEALRRIVREEIQAALEQMAFVPVLPAKRGVA